MTNRVQLQGGMNNFVRFQIVARAGHGLMTY
jgi:hypothetical protein